MQGHAQDAHVDDGKGRLDLESADSDEDMV